jgi:hypothetical protein
MYEYGTLTAVEVILGRGGGKGKQYFYMHIWK